MNDLQKYYIARMTRLAAIIALYALFIPTVVVPFLKTSFGDSAVISEVGRVLSSQLIIVVMLVAGEVVVRKRLWKFERPELDFEGQWEGRTTFTHVVLGQATVPFDATYDVTIEQTSLHFTLAPATGQSFVNWGSLAVELVDKDQLRFAYWVRYNAPDRFPDKAIGYEELRVIQRDDKGRPIVLNGEFAHCAQGQKPVYRGVIEFRRKVETQDPNDTTSQS